MIKKKYSNYTKAELIEELHIMIDNCNALEWQIENQAKFIKQNCIPVEWIKDWASHLYYGISDLVIEKMLKDWEADNNGETK